MTWFFNRKRVELEHQEKIKEAELARKEVLINKNKAKELANAKQTTLALMKLNELVETHGISGILYVASGAERRNGTR